MQLAKYILPKILVFKKNIMILLKKIRKFRTKEYLTI